MLCCGGCAAAGVFTYAAACRTDLTGSFQKEEQRHQTNNRMSVRAAHMYCCNVFHYMSNLLEPPICNCNTIHSTLDKWAAQLLRSTGSILKALLLFIIPFLNLSRLGWSDFRRKRGEEKQNKEQSSLSAHLTLSLLGRPLLVHAVCNLLFAFCQQK